MKRVPGRGRTGRQAETARAKKANTHSFRKTEEWVYEDTIAAEKLFLGGKIFGGGLAKLKMETPHLVLCDAAGKPRFTLGYFTKNFRGRKYCVINSIQQVRTEYTRIRDIPDSETHKIREMIGKKPADEEDLEKHIWDWEKQAQATRQLKRELGNVFPSEHLLTEFLSRMKRLGYKPEQIFMKERGRLYNPLRDRFFEKEPQRIELSEVFGISAYRLSRGKKRVREIFG